MGQIQLFLNVKRMSQMCGQNIWIIVVTDFQTSCRVSQLKLHLHHATQDRKKKGMDFKSKCSCLLTNPPHCSCVILTVLCNFSN